MEPSFCPIRAIPTVEYVREILDPLFGISELNRQLVGDVQRMLTIFVRYVGDSTRSRSRPSQQGIERAR